MVVQKVVVQHEAVYKIPFYEVSAYYNFLYVTDYTESMIGFVVYYELVQHHCFQVHNIRLFSVYRIGYGQEALMIDEDYNYSDFLLMVVERIIQALY